MYFLSFHIFICIHIFIFTYYIHYTTLHYITSHHITLHYITYITWHYITSHYITLPHITSHHITSHHITLHCIYYIASHITVHCITYIQTHTRTHTHTNVPVFKDEVGWTKPFCSFGFSARMSREHPLLGCGCPLCHTWRRVGCLLTRPEATLAFREWALRRVREFFTEVLIGDRSWDSFGRGTFGTSGGGGRNTVGRSTWCSRWSSKAPPSQPPASLGVGRNSPETVPAQEGTGGAEPVEEAPAASPKKKKEKKEKKDKSKKSKREKTPPPRASPSRPTYSRSSGREEREEEKSDSPETKRERKARPVSPRIESRRRFRSGRRRERSRDKCDHRGRGPRASPRRGRREEGRSEPSPSLP